MKLIVGLGNPGKNYQNSRHNVGFMVVDSLVKSVKFNPSTNSGLTLSEVERVKVQSCSLKFKIEKNFKAEIYRLNSEVILVKPQTFMNLSGEPVKKIANFYKILAEDIIIIHDDIDLPLGQLKIQKGGGTAGHHGLESIVKNLGTQDFIRFRVGIGRPTEVKSEKLKVKSYERENIVDYVLERFTDKELIVIEQTIEKTVGAVKYYLEYGLDAAMNEFNG